MSQNERARLRNQAQVIRTEGQPLILRIADETSKATANTVDFITQQRPPSPTSDQKIQVYGIVRFHKQSELKFDEGGRMTFREATIEILSMYDNDLLFQITKAYAVELQDGSIMQITSRSLSEGQETIILETSGSNQIAQ